MADRYGSRITLANFYVNADEHLVHRYIRLRLIYRSFGSNTRSPKVNDVLGFLGIGEAFRARRQNNPWPLSEPLRAAQNTWIVPRSLSPAVSTHRTILFAIQCIRHFVPARRKEADHLVISREDDCALQCFSRVTFASWIRREGNCSDVHKTQSGQHRIADFPRDFTFRWRPLSENGGHYEHNRKNV